MVDDKKFCTSCQTSKPLEGGMVIGTKIKRWKCGGCLAKRTVSPYTKMGKEVQHDHRN